MIIYIMLNSNIYLSFLFGVICMDYYFPYAVDKQKNRPIARAVSIIK
jgi:hypothetical protein